MVVGDPGTTRTPNILIRSQVLYPVELRDRCSLPSVREKGWPDSRLVSVPPVDMKAAWRGRAALLPRLMRILRQGVALGKMSCHENRIRIGTIAFKRRAFGETRGRIEGARGNKCGLHPGFQRNAGKPFGAGSVDQML